MLLQAITLDATFTATATLTRLARYGLWIDATRPEATDWIAAHATRRRLTFHEMAKRLECDSAHYAIAIRCQRGINILWYARTAQELLASCTAANPDDQLSTILALREEYSCPPASDPSEMFGVDGVLMDGSVPVAVNLATARERVDAVVKKTATSDLRFRLPPANGPRRTRGRGSGGGGQELGKPTTSAPTLAAWPRLDAPTYVRAGTCFEVVVGLSRRRRPGIAGGRVSLRLPTDVNGIDLTIDLIANAVDAPAGWSRSLVVSVTDPWSARATFTLRARDPIGPEPFHLTMVEVRYVIGGEICGTASRPLIVGASHVDLPGSAAIGTPWLKQAEAVSGVTFVRDREAADLTIEFAKPDVNPALGSYTCRLYSPHLIATSRGPFEIDLGQDAKTFARGIIEEVRHYSGNELADIWMRALGSLISERLPPEALAALSEVARIVMPRPPAVLIVSADPYVPWELALIEPPLDPTRPPFFGAQALVGRWICERPRGVGDASASKSARASIARVESPSVRPASVISVRHMVVLAGMYMAQSGLRKLPGAEAEAASLVRTHKAIALPATPEALAQLLNADLSNGVERIGVPGAVHVACHGTFDPMRADASRLFLSDGRAISSLLFRAARYGGDNTQPLLFLNACMAGIGGEVIGDMGGFPGNCLRGGFGGILGALWEVDDRIASEIALEFWERALPSNGQAPEPVAAILRDLRTKYATQDARTRVPTYLAYVYYGHPRLVLQRSS